MASSFTIFAHRGASGYCTENTLFSFEMAANLGAEAIELDVHCSRDGVAIVHHDPEINTGRCTVPIADLEWSDIQNLPLDITRKIPSLDEVVAYAHNRFLTNIEIKDPTAVAAVFKSIRGKSVDRFLITSKHESVIQACRGYGQKRPRLGLVIRNNGFDQMFSSLNPSALLKRCPVETVSIHTFLCNPITIEILKRHQLAIYAFTVNQPTLLQLLVSLGVHGIFTDYPDRMRDAMIDVA